MEAVKCVSRPKSHTVAAIDPETITKDRIGEPEFIRAGKLHS
jgi:hypothetical protein